MGKYDVQDASYIQWYLEPEEMSSTSAAFAAYNYKTAKEQMQNQASFNAYKQKMLQRFGGSDTEVSNYLNMARNFVNNKGFQAALNQAIDNLKMPELTNRSVWARKDELSKNAQEFQRLSGQILNALESIISLLGVGDGLSAVMPGTTAEKAIKNMFPESQDYNRIITQKQYQELDSKYRGQYNYLLSLIPDFQAELASGHMTDNGARIISKILMPIQTLIGICNEYQVEIEVNKMLDDFQKAFNNPNIKVSRVGDEGDVKGGFRIGTADLSISMGEEGGSGSIRIPNLGISLKRSAKDLNKAMNVNIKLKGTTIGALMKEIDPSLVTCFYTLYANAQPVVNGKKQAAIPGGTLTNAYACMKAQMLIPALIGNIDSEDLVCIFVINNQAYTVFDLLQMISIRPDGGAMTMKPAFSTLHKGVVAAHQSFYNATTDPAIRSRNIRKMIDNISTQIYLQLSTAGLASI